MLEFLLYFFATIGVITFASLVFFSYLVRRERRSIDESDLDDYR